MATMPSNSGSACASGCNACASLLAKPAVLEVVPKMTIMLRVPTPRPPFAPEPLKGAFLAVAFHLLTGSEVGLVHLVGDDPILEIGLLGDGEIQRASVERLDHTGVADVLPRRDRPRCHAKRKPPGEQRFARRDRSDGETVADQNCGVDRELGAIMLDGQPGFEAARGDGDIVTGAGQAGDLIKGRPGYGSFSCLT